ncbi:FHA domain-containing protein [Variovorax paradoxus]|nr:FHA domain-containing protein [Variovorax paradoxus]
MSKLIVLARHGSVRQFNIGGSTTTIGRDQGCDVQIDGLGVSRRHATIHWTGDRFVLTDMASFNGTFVNRHRVYEHALKNGDAIMMGECQLRFLYTSKALPRADALRLVTQSEDLLDIDAVREKNDWATFFRRDGSLPARLR